MTFRQFSAPIFKPFRQYSWHAAGYLTGPHKIFQTPDNSRIETGDGHEVTRGSPVEVVEEVEQVESTLHIDELVTVSK